MAARSAAAFGADQILFVAACSAVADSPPPPSLLRGTAGLANLDSCISGDGEAPLKLTIAAVACAGSGVVCGIPVQHMREDTMTGLDLRNKRLQ